MNGSCAFSRVLDITVSFLCGPSKYRFQSSKLFYLFKLSKKRGCEVFEDPQDPKSPCITCVQRIGGCTVHCRVFSVLRDITSALGDIMICVGDIISSIGGIQCIGGDIIGALG